MDNNSNPNWIWLEITDARLKGYGVIRLLEPAGSHALLLSTIKKIVKIGTLEKSILLCLLRITRPDGSHFETKKVLFKQYKHSLNSIDGLAAYLEKIGEKYEPMILSCINNSIFHGPMGRFINKFGNKRESDLSRFEFIHCLFQCVDVHELAADNMNSEPEALYQFENGPKLTAKNILDLLELLILWTRFKLNDLTSNDSVEITKNTTFELDINYLDWIFYCGFKAGRVASEVEFPQERQRARGLKRGEKNTAEAEAWWPQGAEWAQKLWDKYPEGWEGRGRPSRSRLAEMIATHWRRRPFHPIGPSRVSARDLEQRIIPAWESRMLFTRKPVSSTSPEAEPHSGA